MSPCWRSPREQADPPVCSSSIGLRIEQQFISSGRDILLHILVASEKFSFWSTCSISGSATPDYAVTVFSILAWLIVSLFSLALTSFFHRRRVWVYEDETCSVAFQIMESSRSRTPTALSISSHPVSRQCLALLLLTHMLRASKIDSSSGDV